MKIGMAMMSHETNTFSPVITDLDRFSSGRAAPLSGQAAIDTYRDTASCLGGYIKVAESRGADIVMGIAANAPPSGRVENDAYEFMCEAIVALSAEVDALLLDLHGAMATRTYDDGEGELLRRIRKLNPKLRIGISLDMHANITADIVDNCDVLAGYHTYPHIDMDGTAERTANAFFDMLEGKTEPTMSWGNAPMLPHVMRQGTDDEPNRALQLRVAELEKTPGTCVSLFTGFPHADIHDAGLSVVALVDKKNGGETDKKTNAGNTKAANHVSELLDQAWQDRHSFVYDIEPLDVSMQHGRAAADKPGPGPVILLDHYDNTASGGTMDTTEVLASILDAGLEDVAVFGFYDPAAVTKMVEAGVGGTVTIELGGKLPMPALQEQSKPLTLTGEVKLLSNGKFKAQVAMARGLTINMGTSAVLSIGSVDIAIISRHIEPYDPECFRCLGIEPTTRRYLMLKSRIHYRVGFMPIAKEIVECAGRGVCTSDYSQVSFENVRRPIFPLDDDPRGSNISRQDFAAKS